MFRARLIRVSREDRDSIDVAPIQNHEQNMLSCPNHFLSNEQVPIKLVYTTLVLTEPEPENICMAVPMVLHRFVRAFSKNIVQRQ